MDHYVYSSRGGLSDTAVSIPRSHAKLKREKNDFLNEESKLATLKIPRQCSPNEVGLAAHSGANAMSVLPRLLRTIANTNNRDTNGAVLTSTAASGHLPVINGNADSDIRIVCTRSVSANDTDASSSSSIAPLISTPSSVPTSSIISFLTPSQLGPVAAMAAATLSVPSTTTTPVPENSEPSGLVTLATASSMFEKEWLARAVSANESSNAAHSTDASDSTLAPTNLITLTVEPNAVETNPDGSPPLVFRTISSSSPHTQTNGSTPVTPTVIDVQRTLSCGLAAFFRETQKQRSASSTPLELPLNSALFPVTPDSGLGSSCTEEIRDTSLNQLTPNSVSTLVTLNPCLQATAPSTGQATESTESTPPAETGGCDTEGPESVSSPPTAFISLQPAPGSILSSSDLQQLMASSEFMTSAARQTLLGSSPDGTTRQLYLLVPSDYPVIMSRASTNHTSSNSYPSPPMLDSANSSAPILEAISPGIEPDDSNAHLSRAPLPATNSQSVTVALPQLASAILPPISSTGTALSTLIAGFEMRNQPSQSRYPLTAVVSNSPSPWSNATTTVQSTNSPRLRLPTHLSGVSLSDQTGISTNHATTYLTASGNGITELLGAVKSDPDMYTPNGHPYPSLVEDANRFRSYAAYAQATGTHELLVGAGRTNTLTTTSAANNSAFFQSSELSSSIVVPPSSLLTPTPIRSGANMVGNANCPGGSNIHSGGSNSSSSGSVVDSIVNTHLLSSPNLPRVNAAFNPTGSANGGGGLSVSSATSGAPMLPANSKVAGASLEECRRNMANSLLNANRNDQGPTTYLEHLNPESKDIRRRVSHNEVERRRRDRINTWISELYKLLPPDEQAKSQYQSKGIVLKRVCEYFQNVDSMLKAANAAVEQARVENSLLAQRNRELQQENQLLSASLHLGAAAAAAHLKNRQPRANSLHAHLAEEVTGAGDSRTSLKEPPESTEYPSTLTVFTVNTNTDYDHGPGFNQTNSTCLVPTPSSAANFVTLSTSNTNPSNMFAVHAVSNSTSTISSTVVNPVTRPLTLPSLDLVANHTDSRLE
ncbi:unnamed protein product [Dicrocoelium dendriticum]|nr:unnamed protein product [Dicrocoelium dendriticum]